MSVKMKVLAVSTVMALFAWDQGGGVVRAQTVHGGGGMKHESAAPATPQGTVIRESKVQGYALTYRIYSWEERNVIMKGMDGHGMPGVDASGKATNHLMVFVKGADGKEIPGIKVGFILTGPDKAEFKTLTMGMSGGHGADVNLRAIGTYGIKTRAVIDGTSLNEEFSYEVK